MQVNWTKTDQYGDFRSYQTCFGDFSTLFRYCKLYYKMSNLSAFFNCWIGNSTQFSLSASHSRDVNSFKSKEIKRFLAGFSKIFPANGRLKTIENKPKWNLYFHKVLEIIWAFALFMPVMIMLYYLLGITLSKLLCTPCPVAVYMSFSQICHVNLNWK